MTAVDSYRGDRVVAYSTLAFGVICLMGSLGLAAWYQRLEHTCVRTARVIVEAEEKQSYDRKREEHYTVYYPTIEYQVAGAKYEFKSHVGNRGYRKGRHLDVLYDPRDPLRRGLSSGVGAFDGFRRYRFSFHIGRL